MSDPVKVFLVRLLPKEDNDGFAGIEGFAFATDSCRPPAGVK
jgi:hypothetical protein